MDDRCQDCGDTYDKYHGRIIRCRSCQQEFNTEINRAAAKRWRKRSYERYKDTAVYKATHCKNEHKRKARQLAAVPSWCDEAEMSKVYQLAQERGLTVDHIIPLVSNTVCGLHTPDNLRCITHELNARKGNRYWPDMPGRIAP